MIIRLKSIRLETDVTHQAYNPCRKANRTVVDIANSPCANPTHLPNRVATEGVLRRIELRFLNSIHLNSPVCFGCKRFKF